MRGAAAVAPVIFKTKQRSISRGLRLPESLDARIKELADEQTLSENSVIVSLLEYALEKMDEENRERAKRK